MDFQNWPVFHDTPESFGCVASPPLSLDSRLWPSAQVIELASRNDLLPPAKRRHVQPGQEFGSRCLSPMSKAPTIVATYGSQHELPVASLATKGLLCHFVKQDGMPPRFWHPVELLLMHSFTGKQMILEHWPDSYRHIGNQICIPHALFGIVSAIGCLPTRCVPISVHDALSLLHDKHVTFDSVHFVDTLLGRLVSGTPSPLTSAQQDNLERFWTFLEGFHLPPLTSWSLEGFCKIDGETSTTHMDALTVDTVGNTAPFLVLQQVHGFCPGLSLHVDAALNISQLDGFWSGIWEFFEYQPDGLVVMPSTCDLGSPTFEGIVVVLKHQQLFVVGANHTDWILECMNGNLRDVYGPLTIEKIASTMLIHDIPQHLPPWEHSALTYVLAFKQCEVRPSCASDASSLGFLCKGAPVHVRIVIAFWTLLLPTDLLQRLGISVEVASLEVGTLVTLKHVSGSWPLPVDFIATHLFVTGFGCLAARLREMGDLEIQVHFELRKFWHGLIPGGFDVEALMDLVHSVSFWTWPRLRILSKGKQFDWRLTLRDSIAAAASNKFYLIPPSHGGGPTGTKTSHALQVRNCVAASLLEEGYELAWVSETVGEVFKKMGTRDLSKILSANHATKTQIALDAVSQCGIDLPKNRPTRTSQAASTAKKAKQVIQPNPANYRLVEGAVLTADKQPLQYVSSFTGQATGYHCMTPSDALPWLTTCESMSKDELILLIFGDMPQGAVRTASKITAPFLDEKSQQVLVCCNLVQFGDKHAVLNTGDGFEINPTATTLIAATVEQSEWSDDWREITRMPFKFFRGLTFLQDCIISMWGRSYRRGRSATTAEDATSVQVHMLISTDKLPAVLRAAGNAMVWLTPKLEDGKPNTAWRLLWLDQKVPPSWQPKSPTLLESSRSRADTPSEYPKLPFLLHGINSFQVPSFQMTLRRSSLGSLTRFHMVSPKRCYANGLNT